MNFNCLICIHLPRCTLMLFCFSQKSHTLFKVNMKQHNYVQWLGDYFCLMTYGLHDDVIKWKHFPRYWPFVREIHRSPVNSPYKGQWRESFVIFFHLRLNKRLIKQWWGSRWGIILRSTVRTSDISWFSLPLLLQNGSQADTRIGFAQKTASEKVISLIRAANECCQSTVAYVSFETN